MAEILPIRLEILSNQSINQHVYTWPRLVKYLSKV